ncbi:hypothetical protein BDN72DRAFT_449742 [Pluteus cervinus]|uniref:Uncharacterized protein n=1 Tax=Pluteus cervinus TaxID=181527 RepID=A0ACD3BF80_9AGAR|nr:hypothetical protein BDN72DRAFT_449742 [Pluteus cervinus]
MSPSSQICRHYLRGTCKLDSACRFTHFRIPQWPGHTQKSDNSRMFPQTSPCRHYVRNSGWCPDGDACAYIHDSERFPFNEMDLKPHCWAFIQGTCPVRRCHYFHPIDPWNYVQYTPCPQWKTCNNTGCTFRHRVIATPERPASQPAGKTQHSRESSGTFVVGGTTYFSVAPPAPPMPLNPPAPQRPNHEYALPKPNWSGTLPTEQAKLMQYPPLGFVGYGHGLPPPQPPPIHANLAPVQPDYRPYPVSSSYPFHPQLRSHLPPSLPLLPLHLQFPHRPNQGFAMLAPPPPYHQESKPLLFSVEQFPKPEPDFDPIPPHSFTVEAPRAMYPAEPRLSSHETELQDQEVIRRIQFAMSPPSLPFSFPTSRSISQPVDPASAMRSLPESQSQDEPEQKEAVSRVVGHRRAESKVRFVEEPVLMPELEAEVVVDETVPPPTVLAPAAPAPPPAPKPELEDYTQSRNYTAEDEFPYRPPKNQRSGHARRISVVIKSEPKFLPVAVGA